MTILAEQVLLMESDVMADTSDGGGRMSGRVVDDGEINNTFPDVSRLDRVYGRTQLRKLFLAVATANQDTLLGAHTILTKTPVDPRVRVTLFKTGSHTDRRLDAQNRVESYVVKATDAPFYFLGSQLVGQRVITCYQRTEQAIPAIGSVLCLQNNFDEEQFVKVADISHTTETFTYNSGSGYVDFKRRVLQLSLTSPLEIELYGPTSILPDDRGTDQSKIYSTQVADAAKYYGAAALAESAAPGDLSVYADSVFNYLVPTAQSETPLADQTAGVVVGPVIPASEDTISVTAVSPSIDADLHGVYYATGAIAPGTLQFNSAAYGNYADDGGKLKHVSGPNQLVGSTVDYSTGQIRFRAASTAFYNSVVTITCIPGAPASRAAETATTVVTLATRGFNYIFTAPRPPAPGTTTVQYMALGNWYTMRDTGVGKLEGDGVGTINYATGTISVTLPALPDVDTSIVWSWGETSTADIQTGEVLAPAAFVEYVAGESIAPGSITLSWTNAGARQLVDDGRGTLTGYGSGTVDYARGVMKFFPTAGATSYSLQYDGADTPADESTHTPTYTAGGNITLTIPGAPVKAGSVSVSLFVERLGATQALVGEVSTVLRTFRDDADGNILSPSNVAIGTINYTTGVITMNPTTTYAGYVIETYGMTPAGHWELGYDSPTKYEKVVAAAMTDVFVSMSDVTVKSRLAAATSSTTTETISAPAMTIDLIPELLREVVPGSVVFTFRGETYRDRAGAIYKNISTLTNAGAAVGSIDYSTGKVLLNEYPDGDGAIVILACLTILGAFGVYSVTFRTAAAPLRQGSLILAGTTKSGVAFQGLANASNADITGTNIAAGSTVDAEHGLVTVNFTAPVWPSTLTYSAVGIKSLPLEAELIGIDPVRLPSDGRVPIFRPADVAVISHTKTATVPSPVAGGVVDFAREAIAEAWVIGANAKRLRPDQYTVDKDAGTLTWATPLALLDAVGGEVTTPLMVYDRVEDMALITDVQVGGMITINSELTHDYPAGESIISSAVLHGDLRARVYNIFHQAAWSTTWADERSGNDTVGKYNSTAYPIEITNMGSIQERWAIKLTSTNTFEAIGETVGVIAAGNTNADFAPTNPATGAPYFTIRSAGWGAGWVQGNTVRFNTDGAQAPFWIVRTTLSGPATENNDQFITQNRGDAD